MFPKALSMVDPTLELVEVNLIILDLVMDLPFMVLHLKYVGTWYPQQLLNI